MKSNNYWQKRAAERMVCYLDDAEKTASEIGKAYYFANRYISDQAADVFSGFAAAFKLSQKEAENILNTVYTDDVLNSLRNAVQFISDPAEKQKALAAISSPAYQYRINKLTALDKNITSTCNSLYKTELNATTDLLTKEIQKAYVNTVYDIQKGYNVGGSFNVIPQSRVDQIMKRNWSGEHYSSRIWKNTQETADELKQTLLTGFLTGQSEGEMSDVIQSRFQVSSNQARRLVRTEATYVTNQAELESLKECGCDEYEFTAVLDDRTSEVCEEHDGKRFKIGEAVAGVDLPPLHPWCRSTIIGVFPSDEEMEALFEQDAEEFGLDEPFDEWVKHLEQTEDGKYIYHKPVTEKEISTDTKPVENEIKPQIETKTFDEAPEWGKIGRYEGEIPLDKSAESGIINYAKATDVFDVNTIKENTRINFDNVVRKLENSEVGRAALAQLKELGVKPEIIYTPSRNGERGSQQGRSIKLFMQKISNETVMAQTLIHETTHLYYGIEQSQWAEAVCFAKEKMFLTGSPLTVAERRYVVKLAKANYPEFEWKRSGI